MNGGGDAALWDERYRSRGALWSGDPNEQLVAELSGLAPRRALEVGCGEGADAIWLAQRGWQVTAVDISGVALERGRAHAEAAGSDVARRITWLREDILAWTPAHRAYDLVAAHFVHFARPSRETFVARLADATAAGGTLLIVAHHPSDLQTTVRRPRAPGVLSTPDDLVAALDAAGWEIRVQEARPREAADAEGQRAIVHDTVLRARRRS